MDTHTLSQFLMAHYRENGDTFVRLLAGFVVILAVQLTMDKIAKRP